MGEIVKTQRSTWHTLDVALQCEASILSVSVNVRSGVPGLDDILSGGFSRGALFLIEGSPGTGKTTLALRFALEGAAAGERTLYITLSETKEELQNGAASHGWSIDPEIEYLNCNLLRASLRLDAQPSLGLLDTSFDRERGGIQVNIAPLQTAKLASAHPRSWPPPYEEPAMKCQCPSETHGHKVGKCGQLATEPDRMCKPCHERFRRSGTGRRKEPAERANARDRATLAE
jgi:hypothetical protein